MPPLGMALSGVNFSDLAVAIGTSPDGKAVLLKYGAFLQTLLDFVIIAFVLFLAIRGINRLKKPAARRDAPAAAAAPGSAAGGDPQFAGKALNLRQERPYRTDLFSCDRLNCAVAAIESTTAMEGRDSN